VSTNTWILSASVAFALAQNGLAHQAFSWTQIRDKFESSNPSLLPGQINIDESRAQEITAFLRPNPDFRAAVDQLDIFTSNPYRPLQFALPSFSASYLHKRQHKFSLRSAFVQALQAKAVLGLARDNLAYYDLVFSVSPDRLAEGDIARADMQRLHLQCVQYESDVQTADVNVRTATLQRLALLNDRTSVEQFEVTGPMEFSESIMPLDEFRRLALDSRPELRAAIQSVDKTRTDHRLAVSNGSTGPTFGLDDAVQNPPIPVHAGFSISMPLRIVDRNHGERARTELDIRRGHGLQEAAAVRVYSDVDSAHAALISSGGLLRPYRATYLEEAAIVRDTVTYSYQYGGASLRDFLEAQQDYGSVRANYLNLVGSYLTAAAELNLAVGREVIQ